MKLSAPKKVTWYTGVVAGVLGLIGNWVTLPVLTEASFILVTIGFAVLAISTIVKNM